MNKKIIISIFSLSILNLGLVNANEKTNELKSSATMQATCNISTNNISFGAVATPLMMQTANNDMNVLCSNAAAYTVDLSYGGVYGSGAGEGAALLAYESSNAQYSYYYVRNSSGVYQGLIACGYAGSNIGKMYIPNAAVASVFGVSSIGWQANNGSCISNNTQAGTYPKGWVGAFNAPGNQPYGGISYAYGVMNGMSKGDKLAYSIAIPGDANKVWNKGINSYNATGTGVTQVIPMNAKIVPDKSGSAYPAPDMYLDTVTAVISY